ncbi:uncharacterized protein LOC110426385 [Herrania umbratica]|uniref:Uncharacterized protein LOC110426385 n=1 Tax=Herrania umbratica TaxID=108875 RepID=A0A6J1BD38_9ROSI|nr:uncharacterized protein LOC110426385 [Herrania umbratica]
MDQVRRRDQAIYLGSLPKMGYKLYGETFVKTSKDAQRDEQATSDQATTTPSQISNEMILNLLMRIDGKLIDQSAKIEKIEEKLQELENLMKNKRKSPLGSTTKHASTTPSQTPTGQVSDSPNFQAEGNEPKPDSAKKLHTPEPETEEKDSPNTEVIGSQLHEETQEAESSPPNSEEVFIMDIFQ